MANNSSGTGEYVTYEEKVGITVPIAIFGAWSVVANTITILAIATRKYMHKQTNIFIFSLALSDLISGLLASPLWLYKGTWGHEYWDWGTFLCRLGWTLDESTSYCTALHIASFSTWRFLMIKFPHKTPNIRSRNIIIYVCVLWAISFVFGGAFSAFIVVIRKPDLPMFKPLPSCAVNFDKIMEFSAYYTFTSSTLILAPMIVVVIMSILITVELSLSDRFKTEVTKIKEKRAVFQLAMITILFFIGYIPIVVFIMWNARSPNPSKSFSFWFPVSAYLCTRFSECMNPIAYNVASKRMRQASVEVLRSLWYCSTKCRRAPESYITSSTPVRSK